MFCRPAMQSGDEPITIKQESDGCLGGRKVAKWGRPLFIALIIVGMIGVGMAGLGAHQGWWSIGSVSNSGQIAMMATGGCGGLLLLALGILISVRIVKNQAKIDALTVSMERLEEILEEGDFTFVRQKRLKGILEDVSSASQENLPLLYSVVARSYGKVEFLLTDVPIQPGLSEQELKKLIVERGIKYKYVTTSPLLPTDPLIDAYLINELLPERTFTPMRLVNGRYALYLKSRDKSARLVTKHSDISPDGLESRIADFKNALQTLKCFQTIYIPPDVIALDDRLQLFDA